MTKARSLLVLLVAFLLGMYSAIPAEDVPETAYDESDSLPYECTLLFSVEIPKPFTDAPVVLTRVSILRSTSLRLCAYRPVRRTSLSSQISGLLIILDHAFLC